MTLNSFFAHPSHPFLSLALPGTDGLLLLQAPRAANVRSPKGRTGQSQVAVHLELQPELRLDKIAVM